MYVSWVLAHAGVQMGGFPSYNTDVSINTGGSNYAVNIYDVQRGDIVIFNWD